MSRSKLLISRPIDISKRENLSPEYLAINPNGVVRAFRHDGRPIIESAVMCEYLDEVFPNGPRLVPNAPVERAHMRAWLRYMDEVPSMAIRVPSFQKVFISRFKSMTEAEFTAFADSNKMGPGGFSQFEYDIAMDQLERTLTRVNGALSGNEFICGSAYTVSDACFTPIIVRLEDLGMASLIKPHKHLHDWYERVQERPSFALAYYQGTRLTDVDIR